MAVAMPSADGTEGDGRDYRQHGWRPVEHHEAS